MSETIQPRTPATQRDADIENYWRHVAVASVQETRAAARHIREARAAEQRDISRARRLGH